jgi:plastocyanin
MGNVRYQICLWAVMTVAEGIVGAQALPAPAVDRVGFPAGYQNSFKKLLTVDRPDNGQIRVVWGNALAASVPWWDRYAYGSVILFESWTSKRNADGSFQYDDNGRLIPDVLGTIFVKRKEVGFGTEYKEIRNGEWEYVAYRADGSVQTAPSASGSCASCHLQGGPIRDWTFRRQQFNTASGGAIPNFVTSQYSFIPGNVTVKKGTTVVWRNDDDIDHQIYVPDLGANSPGLINGGTWTHRFDQEGEYTVRCAIHAGMSAKVTVVR